MKTKYFLISLAAILVWGSHAGFSQTSSWTNNTPFEQKVFIENKGQFDGKDNLSSSSIRYGITDMGQQIYFTPRGLTYRCEKNEMSKKMLKEMKEEQENREEENEGEKERKMKSGRKTILHMVNLEWVNANLQVQLSAEDMATEYYMYGDAKRSYRASAFKKLIYKDLYPNIDVEYIFHEKEGIKYSLILHPGADVSQIQMKYTGAQKVYKDSTGNIHLTTPMGDIVDHAPFTFYESDRSTIPSAFSVKNNIVSFDLGSYDPTRGAVIDPWTVGLVFPVTNKALEVERDGAGNIYLLGGTGGGTSVPIKLKKYTPTGTLIWTCTPPNLNGQFTSEYGDDLKVDRTGKSVYICSGAAMGELFRVNSAGVIIWEKDTFMEPFRMSINCDNSNLILTSGRGDSNTALFIDPATGNTFQTHIGIFNSGAFYDDLRDWVYAPNGNYYGMSVTSPTGGRLFAFSPNMAQLWAIPHGYNLNYWSSAYTGHTNTQPASLHLIAVSKNFIYTTDGAVLNKRNLATGAILTTVTIPGGVLEGNSGIILDTCQNVYVSSQNGVYKYDSNLNFIATAATAGAVYDICLGLNGEILACGNGFLASLNLSACIPASFSVTVTPTPTGCNSSTGSVNAVVTGGIPAYTYQWLPGGQTTASVSGLPAGTYSLVISDADCNLDTVPVTIVAGAGSFSLTATSTAAGCASSNGTATANPSGGAPAYTYVWTPTGQNTQTATGLASGTYSVAVTDASGCSQTQTITVTSNSTLSVSITSTQATCSGNTGSANANPSGGTPAYTYAWTPSGQNTQTATGLASGTYSVTVTDASGCSQTQTIAVTSNNTLSVSVTSTQATCSGNTGTANANPIGGTPAYTYLWNPTGQATPTATGLGSGTYSATVTDASGCSQTLTVTITTANNTLSVSTTSSQASCTSSSGTATANPNGGTPGYTYAWTPTAQNTQTATGLAAGTYTASITDANGCTKTQTVTVTSSNPLTLSTFSTPTGCPFNNGTAIAAPANGTTPYTYNWSNGQTAQNATGLAAGNYTVSVTDANGCTQTQTVSVAQPVGPTASASASANTLLTGGSATLTGTGGGAYLWSPAGGLSCTTCANPIATPGQTTVYCVLVTDINNCTDSACVTLTIDVPCGAVYLPNAFSPNNDLENDKECVMGVTCIETFQLTIYNRWGRIVFESTDPQQCWDGTYKDQPENTAVFAYYLEAITTSGEKIMKKGNISLVR